MTTTTNTPSNLVAQLNKFNNKQATRQAMLSPINREALKSQLTKKGLYTFDGMKLLSSAFLIKF